MSKPVSKVDLDKHPLLLRDENGLYICTNDGVDFIPFPKDEIFPNFICAGLRRAVAEADTHYASASSPMADNGVEPSNPLPESLSAESEGRTSGAHPILLKGRN